METTRKPKTKTYKLKNGQNLDLPNEPFDIVVNQPELIKFSQDNPKVKN